MTECPPFLPGELDAVAHSDDELIQELPLRGSRARKVRDAFVGKLAQKHPLEELFGPLIGALLIMLFQGLFGIDTKQAITDDDINQTASRLAKEYDARIEAEKQITPESPQSFPEPQPVDKRTEEPPHAPKQERSRGATTEPKNPLDELLFIEPEVRISQAQHEIFDWQLAAEQKIDPTTAESITLMVEHGHEFAKDIIAPMSYFTLNYLQDIINEINPGPTSELVLVANHIQEAMQDLKQQQKVQNR